MDWGTPDRDMKHIIFKKLGLMESLPMITLPQTWRIKTSHEEYKAKKEKVAQAFFAKTEQFYPGITENIERYEVATPKRYKAI